MASRKGQLKLRYLRFALVHHVLDSNREQGILVAANNLVSNGELSKPERKEIEDLCTWFDKNVHVPPVLKMEQHFRAVSWFRPEATEAIAKMWELRALLEAVGISVQVLRTDDPGSIVHRVNLQVVAVSKERSR